MSSIYAPANEASQPLGLRRVESVAAAEPAGPRFSSRHIPALDGVRAIAVLLVMISHFRSVFDDAPFRSRWLSQHLFRLFEVGWCGVDLFFALSGLLITSILLDSKGGVNYFKRFYWRRAFRIFPVYYIFLFLMLGVLSRLVHPNPWHNLNPGWYLSYLVNWKPNHGSTDRLIGQAWSLAVEEQFYLVWPLLVLCLSVRNLLRLCLGGVAVALIFRIALTFQGASVAAVYCLTPARMDSLLFGAIIAIGIRDVRITSVLRTIGLPLRVLSLAVIAGIVVLTRSLGYQTAAMHTVGFTAFGSFFSLSVFEAYFLQSGVAFRLLTASLLGRIGRYSYTMYLIHIPLHRIIYVPILKGLAGRADAIIWTVTILYLFGIFSLTFVVAAVSWHCLESPILRFAHSLFPKSGAKECHTSPEG